MPETVKTGTVLIKEGTLLPEALRIESEPYAPGWRLVRNLDAQGLGRIVQGAGWTFFWPCEIGATVFGLDQQRTVRRAVEQILASPKSKDFNSLEIMRVAFVVSKRFLGVCYVSVSARSRHIQKSSILFQVDDIPGRDRARTAAA